MAFGLFKGMDLAQRKALLYRPDEESASFMFLSGFIDC